MAELKTFKPDQIELIVDLWGNRAFALTPVESEGLWVAGVAVKDRQGYSPLSVDWCRIEHGADTYETIADYLDSVNSDLGIDKWAAIEIVCSSMRGA